MEGRGRKAGQKIRPFFDHNAGKVCAEDQGKEASNKKLLPCLRVDGKEGHIGVKKAFQLYCILPQPLFTFASSAIQIEVISIQTKKE
jgi:hypothetical protein